MFITIAQFPSIKLKIFLTLSYSFHLGFLCLEDDRENNERQTLAEFIHDWHFNNYGLKKIATQHLNRFLYSLQVCQFFICNFFFHFFLKNKSPLKLYYFLFFFFFIIKDLSLMYLEFNISYHLVLSCLVPFGGGIRNRLTSFIYKSVIVNYHI